MVDGKCNGESGGGGGGGVSPSIGHSRYMLQIFFLSRTNGPLHNVQSIRNTRIGKVVGWGRGECCFCYHRPDNKLGAVTENSFPEYSKEGEKKKSTYRERRETKNIQLRKRVSTG